MAKIDYRVCDICGKVLDKDIRFGRFRNGYRIINRLFNKIDICDTCISKIKKLSIDKEEENRCYHEIFNNRKEFSNNGEEAIYYQGVEDTIEILSHNRLLKIK